jgi:hypothetical protein
LKHFPEAALFVEKPISCAPVPACYALADILDKKKSIVSVGYMLRYLQVCPPSSASSARPPPFLIRSFLVHLV